MAVCKFCGKEMVGASSCAEYEIVINKTERYRPIPYKKRIVTIFEKEQPRCPDCNVLPGGFHHVGCGIEICPKCGRRWVFCGCYGIKVRTDKRGISHKECKIIPFRPRRR